jgi:hypothetical protein
MPHLLQFDRQFAHTLAGPSQWRLRIASRHRLHQSFQIFAQTAILLRRFLASTSWSANASLGNALTCLQFSDPITDDLAGKSCCTRHC